MSGVAYKLVDRAEWTTALAAGAYAGSAVDLADGYIHMSTAAQLAETARRHYAGRRELVLVEVDLAPLGAALKWEPSRGGDLFPHVYGAIDTGLAISHDPLPLEDGVHRFPEGAA